MVELVVSAGALLVSGVNLRYLIHLSFEAGKVVQRLEHVEKKLDRLNGVLGG